MRTVMVRFQQNLLPLQGGRFTQVCPLNGEITTITFHFPAGCAQLVDVVAGHAHKRAYPLNGYIALDNATPVYPVHEPVEDNELLWIEVLNGDGLWPHQINVIFTLEGVIA